MCIILWLDNTDRGKYRLFYKIIRYNQQEKTSIPPSLLIYRTSQNFFSLSSFLLIIFIFKSKSKKKKRYPDVLTCNVDALLLSASSSVSCGNGASIIKEPLRMKLQWYMAHKSGKFRVLIYTLIKVCTIHILQFKCSTNRKVNEMQILLSSYIFNFHVLVHSGKCTYSAIKKLNPTVQEESHSNAS